MSPDVTTIELVETSDKRGPHQEAMRAAIVRAFEYLQIAQMVYADACLEKDPEEREVHFHAAMHTMVEKASSMISDMITLMPCQREEEAETRPGDAALN